MYDFVPGGGFCSHVKRVQPLNYQIKPYVLTVEDQDVPSSFYQPPPLQELEWANLPSSTETNIIVLLAEMDEILATLTWKFWKHLSYGAITWGIVPLISEIESGLKAINNIAKSIDGTHYEATTYTVDEIDTGVGDTALDFPGCVQPFCSYAKFTRSVKYHASGTAHYQELGLESMLDRLGFHPDLATLWELVPFSFVVDYIFPIGKFLEGLRRGGWVKAVYFDGWISAKVNTSGYVYQASHTPFRSTPHHIPFEYNAYYRYRKSTVLVAPEAELPSFELPTFEEIFNVAYLANKRLRKIVPPVHWDWVIEQEDS